MKYPKTNRFPLLIYTNTNDKNMNVLKIEHLIKSIKAEGKPFNYDIFEVHACRHSFDRMNPKIGKEIRKKFTFTWQRF